MSKVRLMKVLTVVGARPQIIKAAIVSHVLSLNKYKTITEVMVHTGQHYDKNMSQNFFTELNIPTPAYNLNIGSGKHGWQTGMMMTKLEPIMEEVDPDVVLLYGDTNSTLAGALVASKLQYKILHIESGLRSYRMDIPEESNRIITDCISDILFCPTKTAVENLKKEGRKDGVHLTGDVSYDGFLFYKEISLKRQCFDKFRLKKDKYILATIHRAENTSSINRLQKILKVFKKISLDCEVIIPLHPRTRNKIESLNLLEDVKGIRIMEPVSYLEMISLLINSRIVITDSGGVQKEAYFSKTPCVTLRDETEWIETLEYGWNRLVSPFTEENIESSILDAMSINRKDKNYSEHFGSGNAATSISNFLLDME